MLLFLIPLSCTKDPDPPQNVLLSKDVSHLLEQAQEDADAAWESISLNPDPDTDEPALAGGKIRCHCSYRILDFEYTPYGAVATVDFPSPLEPNPIDALFWSSQECAGGATNGCKLLSGIYTTGPVRFDPNGTSCYDQWKTMPPEGLFPFNCMVPGFSVFPVSFALPGSKVQSWKLTFQVVCQDARGNAGQGYGYISEPLTISYPGNAQSENWGQIYVKLSKCGCIPRQILLRK